jgi:predicted transcriptional regulator
MIFYFTAFFPEKYFYAPTFAMIALSSKKLYYYVIGATMATTTSRGIKLDVRTQERLQALAQIRDRSPHYLMKAAIENFLDREEAYERKKQEDQERYERYQLTGEAVSGQKAAAWLESLAAGKKKRRPR